MSAETSSCTEEWRPVKGYEGIYSVSNAGRMRRDLFPVKLMTPTLNNCGYLVVCLYYKGAKRKQVGVHRIILQAFQDPPDGRNQVNHKNGDKTDNRLENLEWCTLQENIIHAFRVLGRKAPRGMDAGGSKLADIDIVVIRRLLELGVWEKHVGALFGVSQTCINKIKQKRNWAHI